MSGPIQLTLVAREQSLDAKFAAFCESSPEIVAEFERRALALIARGRDHFSADAILHSIRFDTAMSEGGEFKINNNWTSRLARRFAEKYPQHASLFWTRKLVAA